MSTSEQPTCGKGLAENSILPRKLGQLIAAMAENLAVHSKALDLTDQNSRTEYDAYEKLVKELRQTAAQLERTAGQMVGYRDLPMGRHDEKAMTHPRVLEVFEQFVKQKQEVMALLEQTAARDNELLEMMRAHIH
jgi:hypothetical protein